MNPQLDRPGMDCLGIDDLLCDYVDGTLSADEFIHSEFLLG